MPLRERKFSSNVNDVPVPAMSPVSSRADPNTVSAAARSAARVAFAKAIAEIVQAGKPEREEPQVVAQKPDNSTACLQLGHISVQIDVIEASFITEMDPGCARISNAKLVSMVKSSGDREELEFRAAEKSRGRQSMSGQVWKSLGM